MAVKFKYVPTSGALSGKSFESQTEKAFNDLGANIDQAAQTSDEALEIARNAQNTANQAVTTVDMAVAASNQAKTAAAGMKGNSIA